MDSPRLHSNTGAVRVYEPYQFEKTGLGLIARGANFLAGPEAEKRRWEIWSDNVRRPVLRAWPRWDEAQKDHWRQQCKNARTALRHARVQRRKTPEQLWEMLGTEADFLLKVGLEADGTLDHVSKFRPTRRHSQDRDDTTSHVRQLPSFKDFLAVTGDAGRQSAGQASSTYQPPRGHASHPPKPEQHGDRTSWPGRPLPSLEEHLARLRDDGPDSVGQVTSTYQPPGGHTSEHRPPTEPEQDGDNTSSHGRRLPSFREFLAYTGNVGPYRPPPRHASHPPNPEMSLSKAYRRIGIRSALLHGTTRERWENGQW
ncbi:hypothetical protein JCM5296_000767 [Sporobolomyces johnsonii]